MTYQNYKQPSTAKVGTLTVPSLPIVQAILVSLLAVLGVAYLIELNLISQRGFEVRKLEVRLQKLRETNSKFQLQLAELESMNGIEARIAELGMIPVGSVEYVSLGGTVVARR